MSGLDWRRARTFKSREDKAEPPAYRDRMDRTARKLERFWMVGLSDKDAAALSGKSVAEVKAMRSRKSRRRKPS